MNASISIGVLAQQTGCTVPTIRYYEEIGLLPASPRTEAGRRLYGAPAVKRLTFIRRCRDFGFSIEQVRELMGLIDEPDAASSKTWLSLPSGPNRPSTRAAALRQGAAVDDPPLHPLASGVRCVRGPA